MTSDNLGLERFKDILTGEAYDESAWVTLGALVWANLGRPKWKRVLGRWLHRLLAKRGWVLVLQRKFDADTRQKGGDWPLVGYTMIGRKRLDHLHACMETIQREHIPGNLIETGVWRGGSCMLMKAVLQTQENDERIVYLADSFTGLPPPKNARDGWDLSGNPYLEVSADQVRRNFERFDLWDERVRLIPGWFADTLATAETGSLAILRLDGDLYESTRVAIEALYDRVSPGGFIIVDDYYSWSSCKRAIDEFIASRKLQIILGAIDDSAVFWRKPTN